MRRRFSWIGANLSASHHSSMSGRTNLAPSYIEMILAATDSATDSLEAAIVVASMKFSRIAFNALIY